MLADLLQSRTYIPCLLGNNFRLISRASNEANTKARITPGVHCKMPDYPILLTEICTWLFLVMLSQTFWGTKISLIFFWTWFLQPPFLSRKVMCYFE